MLSAPPRTLYAYGYVRVSSPGQVDSGLSLEGQDAIILAYFAKAVEPLGIQWGRMFIEPAVSAHKKNFRDRPCGRVLHAVLQPGDHILISRHDRAFRGNRDFHNTLDPWLQRGIVVHVLNLGLNTGNKAGLIAAKLTASVMVATAQYESECISERTKLGFEMAKAKGLWVHANPPIGQRAVPWQKRWKLAPHEPQRELCRKIARLHFQGMEWYQVCATMTRNGDRLVIYRDKLKFIVVSSSPWQFRTVTRYFAAYERMVEAGELEAVENDPRRSTA